MKCIHFYEFEGDLSTTHFYICHAANERKEYGKQHANTHTHTDTRVKRKKRNLTHDNNRTFKFRRENENRERGKKTAHIRFEKERKFLI